MKIQGGQVDTGETLADRLKRLETPIAATATPLGATRAGATPNQAKMARSPARLQSLTQQALKSQPTPPEQTLQTVERQSQGMGAVNAQDQSAQLQATQSLAGMSAMAQQRVQAAINTRLNNLATQQKGQAQTLDEQKLRATLGVTGQGLDLVQLDGNTQITQNEAVTQFQQKLQEYAQNPTQDKLVELETLRRAAGFQGDLTSSQGINNLFMQAGAATGTTAATALQDKLTVKDFEPAELGFNSFTDLANTLGVDPATIQDMSVEELKRQTQLAVDREKQHIEDLRAKLASSPPGSAQRMIYERRLNNVLAGGASQIELKTAEAAEDISTADRIRIGDQELTVADVLDDAKLSARIEAYLYSSPAQRDRLFPPDKFSELREWIEANELALNDLASTLAEEQEGWQESLDAWRNLGDLSRIGAADGVDVRLSNELISAIAGNVYDPNKLVTQAQVDAVRQAIKDSPVGQLMQDPANAAKIQALDPEDLTKLKDANNQWNSLETINQQYAAGQAFSSDATYKKFAGANNHSGDYATSADMIKHAQAAPVYEQVKNNHRNWLADDDFMNASLATKKAFADNPQRFKEFNDLRTLKTAIQGPVRSDANSLSKAMFGHDLASMETMFNALQRQSGFNRAAANQLETFKRVFGGDGNPVSGFWNVANPLVANADQQNIDTAAQGQAAELLAQIKAIKDAKFNERPQPYSVYGSKDAAGNPVSGISTNPPMRIDALYDIAERVTGNQPLNQEHFVALVDAVKDYLQLSDSEIDKAIAIVNDEFTYANKAAATQEDIKLGNAPENFPVNYEHAKQVYNQLKGTASKVAQARAEQQARAAEVEAEKQRQAQAEEERKKRDTLTTTTTAKVRELSKTAQQASLAVFTYLQGPIPFDRNTKARQQSLLENSAKAYQQVIDYLEAQFKSSPWLKDNADLVDELRRTKVQQALINSRLNEYKRAR
jgi:sRNA-binding protein